ncbi:hypothetical protein EST38_g6517 [Candolleomyces aberdarensis]|uniref:Nephrocystin 3-like N-terminal domain-containing protein n=1 Tax=Candolleomyces aberdarensis TaxID=2316362 RepID=A0A4Q2DHX1_9AGAR|nr:hypothetical protein EST38_g6517 [Candolleomyces aberdarensis]
MRSLPLLEAPAAPQPPPRQRLVQNQAQFGSGSIPEPSLPSLYNPYPHLPSLDTLGAVLDSTFAASYSWEGMNQSSSYTDITVKGANPQAPAASIIDIPLQTFFQTSYQWTAEDLELLSNLPPLELPSHCSNPAPEAGSNLDLTHSPSLQRTFSNGQHYVDVPNNNHLKRSPPCHVVSFDDGLSQGSVALMAANVPGVRPPPSHHSSLLPAPALAHPVDDLNYYSPQPQQENSVVDPSHSTVVPTSAREGLWPLERSSALRPNESLVSSRAHGGTTSFLPGASGFRMRDIQYFEASHITVNASGPGTSDKSIDGWKLLREHTAPNALYNSSARYDAPKCDEDTRVEVTRELMEWIEDRDGPQRLLGMTGAAGSGKSALQQTIAERCAKGNILGAAYFISAGDPSRNTASTIIPTIAYQLGSNHPTLQRWVAAAVERDPLIFSRSLETQMDVLVVRPFESFQTSGEYDISTFPHVILIDGLDECQGEPDTTTNLGRVKMKYKAEDRQAELLSAIKNSLLDNDLPFRIFIASRPEWAIHTALGPTGSLHRLAYQIQLSDQYNATEDMRRYLRRRFQDIGLRIGQPNWFTEGNIETLVQAGSGQFVYVATVFKYVSERRASPVHMLNTVLNWTPGQAARPFEALDMLYANILLNAKESYEAVDAHSGRDFLLLFRTFCLGENVLLLYINPRACNRLSSLLNLESNASEILTLDLRSLVYLKENESGTMEFTEYHKSFSDFMYEESRAKDLFVPNSRVWTHLGKCCMQHIMESPELHSLSDKWEDMPVSEQCLVMAIADLDSLKLAVAIDDEIVDFTHKGGWHKIDMALSKPSGFGIIFFDKVARASEWIENLGVVANCLKERRPEAAAIMSKYFEKWEHFIKEKEREDQAEWQSMLRRSAPDVASSLIRLSEFQVLPLPPESEDDKVKVLQFTQECLSGLLLLVALFVLPSIISSAPNDVDVVLSDVGIGSQLAANALEALTKHLRVIIRVLLYSPLRPGPVPKKPNITSSS